MIRSQNPKIVFALNYTTASNGGTLTSSNIDTREFDRVSIIVQGSTSDAASNNPSVLKLQESDDTVVSNFADITAAVGDGTGGFVIANSPTATTTIPFAFFDGDLTGRKRYLRLLISPTTTQGYTAVALLTRAKELPNNTTEQNVAQAVIF